MPYDIMETLVKGNSTILDAECELNIIDDSTQDYAVDFRSFFNNWDGTYHFLWDNQTLRAILMSETLPYHHIVGMVKLLCE